MTGRSAIWAVVSEGGSVLITSCRTLGLVAILVLSGCGDSGTGEHLSRPGLTGRSGVREIEPDEAAFEPSAGQTLYVPAYSTILTTDRAQGFDLAVTLCVRNLDRDRPIVLTSVTYHDQDGRLLRDYLTRPIRLAPLASMTFFVREDDTGGGISPSFLIEWKAEGPAEPPIAQAVMAGTASAQGLSFVTEARVLSDRAGSIESDRD